MVKVAVCCCLRVLQTLETQDPSVSNLLRELMDVRVPWRLPAVSRSRRAATSLYQPAPRAVLVLEQCTCARAQVLLAAMSRWRRVLPKVLVNRAAVSLFLRAVRGALEAMSWYLLALRQALQAATSELCLVALLLASPAGYPFRRQRLVLLRQATWSSRAALPLTLPETCRLRRASLLKVRAAALSFEQAQPMPLLAVLLSLVECRLPVVAVMWLLEAELALPAVGWHACLAAQVSVDPVVTYM
jgi:hypothetical protein